MLHREVEADSVIHFTGRFSLCGNASLCVSVMTFSASLMSYVIQHWRRLLTCNREELGWCGCPRHADNMNVALYNRWVDVLWSKYPYSRFSTQSAEVLFECRPHWLLSIQVISCVCARARTCMCACALHELLQKVTVTFYHLIRIHCLSFCGVSLCIWVKLIPLQSKCQMS